MPSERATSIDNLPGDPQMGGGSQATVNEILNEINPGGNGDPTQIFQRQTDGMVTSPTESFVPQTVNDVQEIHGQQQQHHQQQQPGSDVGESGAGGEAAAAQFAEGQPSAAAEAAAEEEQQQQQQRMAASLAMPPLSSYVAAPEKRGFDIMTFAKTVLLFALIYMVFSLRKVRDVLMKIPSFQHEGNPTVIGTVIIALVGGMIMGGVQAFV